MTLDKEPRPKTAAEVAEMELRRAVETCRAAGEPINWILAIFLEFSDPKEAVPALRASLTKDQLRELLEAEGMVAKRDLEQELANLRRDAKCFFVGSTLGFEGKEA